MAQPVGDKLDKFAPINWPSQLVDEIATAVHNICLMHHNCFEGSLVGVEAGAVAANVIWSIKLP